MNIENAKKLVGQLERLPDEKFWMAGWIVHPSQFVVFRVLREQSCGTVGCIAGWASLGNGGPTDHSDEVRDWAQNWLSLDDAEAWRLFGGHWARYKNNRQKPLERITRSDAIAELKRMIAEAEKASA